MENKKVQNLRKFLRGTKFKKSEKEFQGRCNLRYPRKNGFPQVSQKELVSSSFLGRIGSSSFSSFSSKFPQVPQVSLVSQDNLKSNPKPKEVCNGECKAEYPNNPAAFKE